MAAWPFTRGAVIIGRWERNRHCDLGDDDHTSDRRHRLSLEQQLVDQPREPPPALGLLGQLALPALVMA